MEVLNKDVDDDILREFVLRPDKIHLYEEHDFVYFHELVNSVNISKRDKGLLNHAIKKKNKPGKTKNLGTETIPFEYVKNISRYTANSLLLSLSVDLRAKVYENYESLDIVNRNYSIMKGFAQKHGIEILAIDYFVQNYERFCKENSPIIVKQNFSDFIYHMNHHEGEDEVVENVIDNLLSLKEYIRSRYSQYTLLQIIEIYSTQIINCVYEYLVNNKIIKNEHCLLGNNVIYFKPLVPFEKEAEKKAIEEYVHKKTKVQIKLH